LIANLGTIGAQSLSTQSGANAPISVFDTAIETVSTRRGAIGAM
jgi:flagellin-like hook-associated protein FlgL